MKLWQWLALLVVVAVAGAAFAFRGDLSVMAYKRLAPRQMTADTAAALPDGLHVALCGTGSPLPDPKRSGPCTAIIAGTRIFVVDSGDGAGRMLARMSLTPGRIAGVFLTHFHSDHIDGLGAVSLYRWAGGQARTQLPLHGPAGVERVAAGFNEAYAQDSVYRVAHHGADTVAPEGFGLQAVPFAFAPGAQSAVVFEQDGLKVTAFTVEHTPVSPAVGYRFDYKGRSVVISGDTVRSANLEAVAKGADLLVHEALAPNVVGLMEESARSVKRDNLAKIFKDIPDYHASPADAAASGAAAGVKAVVLTHIVPGLPTRAMEPVFLNGATFKGDFWIGRDGDLVSLPADSAAITRKNLL